VLTFLLRGVLRPIRAVSRAAARFARGELDARVPDTGIGEVAMLAASFNRMAESSEVRTTELASAHERLARAATVAEEASRMKSTFLANMSHEVRTPLHGLLGMLALLGETSLDDDQRAYLDVAQSSSDALMRVVGDVLDIARIEAGRLEIEQLEFDLHETVRSVCGLMGLAAGDKRLSLRPSIDAGVPPLVIGDRTRVAQVLQNLVSNAVKFTPEGEVSVAVSVVSSDFGRIVVRFAVRDTGIGIEPAQLSRLFEPFVQAEPGTTRKFGGSGLGLAIARELTELMGGSIAAESVPGHGSTFSFDLPFVSAPARPAALPGSPGSAAVAGGERAPASGLPDEDAADENGRQARRGAAHDGPAVPGARRILVAEDHDVNWIVMERMLASREHLAERAVDGEQVLEKVAAARYDLLLLDCQMPIRDGFETARELRRRELEAAAQCASPTPSVRRPFRARLTQIERQFGKGTVMRMGDPARASRSTRSRPARSRSTSRSGSAACRGAGSSRSSARSPRVRRRSSTTSSPRRRSSAGSARSSTPSTRWTRSTPRGSASTSTSCSSPSPTTASRRSRSSTC
jgi:signal transduction histidine kinase